MVSVVILRYVSDKDTEKNQTKGAEGRIRAIEVKLPNVKFGLLHGWLSSEEKQAALDLFAVGQRGVSSPLPWCQLVWTSQTRPSSSSTTLQVEAAPVVSVSPLYTNSVAASVAASTISMLPLKYTNRTRPAKSWLARVLAVLEKTNDGFRVAESDLQLRGAGDLWGSKQSGNGVELFHASLATDLYLLSAAAAARGNSSPRANAAANESKSLPAPVLIALEKRAVVDVSLEAKFGIFFFCIS